MSTNNKFDPRNLLNVAKELKNSKSDQAHIRSVVNRAYYAAYGHINANIEKIRPFNSEGYHQACINYLKTNGKPTFLNAGKILEKLFFLRKKADYDYSLKNRFNLDLIIKDATKITELTKS